MEFEQGSTRLGIILTFLFHYLNFWIMTFDLYDLNLKCLPGSFRQQCWIILFYSFNSLLIVCAER